MTDPQPPVNDGAWNIQTTSTGTHERDIHLVKKERNISRMED